MKDGFSEEEGASISQPHRHRAQYFGNRKGTNELRSQLPTARPSDPSGKLKLRINIYWPTFVSFHRLSKGLTSSSPGQMTVPNQSMSGWSRGLPLRSAKQGRLISTNSLEGGENREYLIQSLELKTKLKLCPMQPEDLVDQSLFCLFGCQ